MAWATEADVLDRWVGDNPPAIELVQTWIADAETLVAFEYPDIQTRIDDLTLPLARVKLVVSRMVIRALRNPDNIRQTASGPFSTTYAGDEPGGLQLTDADRKLLGVVSLEEEQAAFTVDTYPAVYVIHAETCALRFGAAYCSCGATIAGVPIYGPQP